MRWCAVLLRLYRVLRRFQKSSRMVKQATAKLIITGILLISTFHLRNSSTAPQTDTLYNILTHTPTVWKLLALFLNIAEIGAIKYWMDRYIAKEGSLLFRMSTLVLLIHFLLLAGLIVFFTSCTVLFIMQLYLDCVILHLVMTYNTDQEIVSITSYYAKRPTRTLRQFAPRTLAIFNVHHTPPTWIVSRERGYNGIVFY